MDTEASTRRRLLAGTFLIGTFLVMLVVGLRHPGEFALAPRCPIQATTGLLCPGCGSGRAIHHLANGRIQTAWNLNPMLLIIGLPLLAIALVSETRLAISGTVRQAPHWMLRLGLLAGIILIAWGIIRNLPIDSPIPLVPNEFHESGMQG